MAKRSSLNRKEMIKESILEHLVGIKNNGKGKTWIDMVVFFVFLNFLNMSMVEAKIISLMWFKMHMKEIFKTILL